MSSKHPRLGQIRVNPIRIPMTDWGQTGYPRITPYASRGGVNLIPCNAHISYCLSWGVRHRHLSAYTKSFSFFSSKLICGDRTCTIYLQSVMSRDGCTSVIHTISFLGHEIWSYAPRVQLILSESRLFIHLYPPKNFPVYFNEQMNRRDSLKINWTQWCIWPYFVSKKRKSRHSSTISDSSKIGDI